MDDLATAVDSVVVRVAKHGSKGFNEENTAVVLIEPVLHALGWDLADLSSVDRQYRVFDGTKLDYALKIDGKPNLFIEVKALGQSLDDAKFIAQTVNYANNEGVLWCVLTNGLVYRIYKTNEPVGMADKLLLEVDVRSVGDEPSRAATLSSLRLMSRESLLAGHLVSKAELVFTGGLIREALEALLAKPNSQFRAAVEKAAGQSIEKDRLDRILSHFSIIQRAVVNVPTSSSSSGPAHDPAATAVLGYTKEHHTASKPRAIVELFDQLDDRVRALGDVAITYTRTYVNYSAPKKSFMTAELFRDKLKLYFSIPWHEAPKPLPSSMRDVTKIGHYGMGDTEFVLSSQDQLDDVQALATVSFERNRSK